jgi:hypothetical protein
LSIGNNKTSFCKLPYNHLTNVYIVWYNRHIIKKGKGD